MSNAAEADKREMLDPGFPDNIILSVFGHINLAWSQLDYFVSAALFSLIKMDAYEFHVLVGRQDIAHKVEKLKTILKHRGDKVALPFVAKLLTEINAMKEDRNALVHGFYSGKTKDLEVLFVIANSLVIEEGEPSAHLMKCYAPTDLSKHMERIVALLVEFPKYFDVAAMREALGPVSREAPDLGKKKKVG